MSTQRIERIIDLKEKLMEDKQREIENTLGLMNKITNGIIGIDNNINSNYERMTITSISGNDFCVIKDNLTYLENRKSELMEQKEAYNKKVSILRMELIEQAREVKKLETLESKTLQVIKKARNRKEQKSLDEIALKKQNI
ncbi:MAG: flagellar export protein FliJ [Proteobacteria bacterium]|nr:flagellar export protein FliJ [Pseudomonadota bacterium]